MEKIQFKLPRFLIDMVDSLVETVNFGNFCVTTFFIKSKPLF